MSPLPEIIHHPMFRLLQDSKIDEFNKRRDAGEDIDLRGANFRGLELRGANFSNLDLSDAYFKLADIRGINFKTCKLEGASFLKAHISGAYFPDEVGPVELRLSVELGTRIRYNHLGVRR